MNGPQLTGAMRVLAGLLQARTGQFLSDGRLWRIETSLRPLMRAHGLAGLDHLVDRLLSARDEGLIGAVVDALLNNESSFFRDQHVFHTLAHDVLPAIAQTRPDKVMRIWSAGCSSGQEAYSLAMIFAREPERWAGWRIQILGTDISSTMIARARAGLYSQIDVQRGLAINDLLAWFEPVDEEWRIADTLRAMVDFRVDNMFECAVPVGAYDLVLCRNVLLYFSAPMRKQMFTRLARHSAPGGYLVLGAGETVIDQTEHFSPSPDLRGMYRRGPHDITDEPGVMTAFSLRA